MNMGQAIHYLLKDKLAVLLLEPASLLDQFE